MTSARQAMVLAAVAAIAGAGGWWGHLRWSRTTTGGHSGVDHPTAHAAQRRVLYYQSPMHPWIKSDAPGRCTICGMELSPVHEGDAGFGGADGVVSLGSNSVQVLNVQTSPVRRGPLRRTLRVSGTIDDNDQSHRILSAYTDGRIDRLFVNHVGAEVTAGQPLATFYSPALLAARREYQSLLRGHAAAGGGGVEAGLVAAAAQRLQQLGLSPAQIAAVPNDPPTNLHTEILAPMGGTVVARQVYEGQYVKEGERLFEIADFSVMWFLFEAYERDLAWLAPGLKVAVTTPSLPGKTLPGAIAFIDPNLNPQTRSARIRVELANPVISTNHGRIQRALLHRLFAEAVVDVTTPAVLLVPRPAVLAPGTSPTVYVDRGGGSYEARRVRLGRAGDDAWEVLGGLDEGETVVTSGNLLMDGQAQMNGLPAIPAGTPPAAPAVTAAGTNWPVLADAPRAALESWLTLVAGLGASLAADDLAGFSSRIAPWSNQVQRLAREFGSVPALAPVVAQLTALVPAEAARDLPAARQWFHPAAQTAAALAELARHQSPAMAVHIFECPMVNSAVPNVPRKGRWIQVEPGLRNPFFGAAMLTCGREIAP